MQQMQLARKGKTLFEIWQVAKIISEQLVESPMLVTRVKMNNKNNTMADENLSKTGKFCSRRLLYRTD